MDWFQMLLAAKGQSHGSRFISAAGAAVCDSSSKAAKVVAAPASVAKGAKVAPKNKVSATPKKKVAVNAAAVPVEEAPVADDAPLIPAKLLRSVSPEYPADAMRNFITGDVKLRAEVNEKGKIRNVEVVSGPKALQESAIATFKQYEYAPATKGGKGVASQVKVTIKFWFVP
jgi:protein TonB